MKQTIYFLVTCVIIIFTACKGETIETFAGTYSVSGTSKVTTTYDYPLTENPMTGSYNKGFDNLKFNVEVPEVNNEIIITQEEFSKFNIVIAIVDNNTFTVPETKLSSTEIGYESILSGSGTITGNYISFSGKYIYMTTDSGAYYQETIFSGTAKKQLTE